MNAKIFALVLLVSMPGMMMGMLDGDSDDDVSPPPAQPTGTFTKAKSPDKVVAINPRKLQSSEVNPFVQTAQSAKDLAAMVGYLAGWPSDRFPAQVIGTEDPKFLEKLATALQEMGPTNKPALRGSSHLLDESEQPKPIIIDVRGFSELIAGGGDAGLTAYLKAHKVQGTVFSLAAAYGAVQGGLKLYKLASGFLGKGQTSPA